MRLRPPLFPWESQVNMLCNVISNCVLQEHALVPSASQMGAVPASQTLNADKTILQC